MIYVVLVVIGFSAVVAAIKVYNGFITTDMIERHKRKK